MKKFLKSLFAILLALVVCATPAYAKSETYSEGYFYYAVADESVTITGYFGHEETVRVPASIAGLPVNAIADGAFKDTGVETLYLPETIMYVGEDAAGTAKVVFADEEQERALTEVVPGDSDSSGSEVESAASGVDSSETESGESSERKDDELTVDDDESDEAVDKTQGSDGKSTDEAVDTSVKEHDGVTIATSGQPPVVPMVIVCTAIAGLIAFLVLRKKASSSKREK